MQKSTQRLSMLAVVFVLSATSPCPAQQSLTLHDAIARASASPAAQLAQQTVDAAKAAVRGAGVRPNPRLYLQSEDLRPWADSFSFTQNTEDYAYVGQTIEIAGKRSKRLASANAMLLRSEAERTIQLQQLAGRVAASYWAAAVAFQVRDLLQQDYKAVGEMVRYHRERVDAGAMRGVDLLRMQIEQDRIQLALASSERDAQLARIDLFRQIGIAPAATIQLADTLSSATPVPPLPIEAALAQRADLIAAKDAVTAAQADLKLEQANRLPDPDLFAGYKRNSSDNTLYGGLQMQLPFNNRNQGSIEQAKVRLAAAQASQRQLDITARAEIAAAEENYTRQREIVLQTLPDMQARASKNLQILDEAYRTGGIDLLRYIDAERTQIDVAIMALRTQADYQQSALRLQLAYGEQP